MRSTFHKYFKCLKVEAGHLGFRELDTKTTAMHTVSLIKPVL